MDAFNDAEHIPNKQKKTIRKANYKIVFICLVFFLVLLLLRLRNFVGEKNG